MDRTIELDHKYIGFPIKLGCGLRFIEGFDAANGQKVMEFQMPVDDSQEAEYACDYYAYVPSYLIGHGDVRFSLGDKVPDVFGEARYVTSEGENEIKDTGLWAFLDAIICTDEKQIVTGSHRPHIHFTAQTGWTNDPNGMVYRDGVYHLYFQYNPFDVQWQNMCWGHAVSTDLIHWEEKDIVMVPDEQGTIYSGSGVINEHHMLGLPEDAIICLYTAAGYNSRWSKGLPFTQRTACSVDGGNTFTKAEAPSVEAIYSVNRDPKIFWYEDDQDHAMVRNSIAENGAYIMALYLDEDIYSILRSEDLVSWKITQQIRLEKSWECPDLFRLYDENGQEHWFYWTASGLYFPCDFDGYKIVFTDRSHEAYMNQLAYAAQTFSGTGSRTISIPWYRLENDGSFYTGTYGIPMELTWKQDGQNQIILQYPVKEFFENAELVWSNENLGYYLKSSDAAIALQLKIGAVAEKIKLSFNGVSAVYDPMTGIMTVGDEEYQVGAYRHELLAIIDDRVLELFFDQGERMLVCDLGSPETSLEIVSAADRAKVFRIS